MISWLNFEELLIHNPIELINFSKSNIQVALSKKQYIDFFSNKSVYMGLYYSEEMDFCVMFYADPLQSYKNGEMYAEGYIDVDMKIYRVKVLSSVSIKYPSSSLQSTDGTQGVPQDGGKYTHIAWAYGSDGSDRFSTIYPRFNLLDGTKDFSGDWINSSSWITDGTYKGLTVKTQNAVWRPITKKFTVSSSGTYTLSEYVRNTGSSNVQSYLILNGSVVAQTANGNNFDWKRVSFVKALSAGDVIALETHNGTTGQISIAGKKIERDSFATPYMPSENETTKLDRPSYIGQYTDYTLEDSTNPSSYIWREIQEDKWNVTKTGMLVSPQDKQITMVQAGALMRCEINNNITGWTDGTTQLNYTGQDFIIDGYGMRGLHNG